MFSMTAKEDDMTTGIVDGNEKERSLHRGAIHELARATGVPEREVGLIYQKELEKLEKSARVKDYLPVLTCRVVKDSLRYHTSLYEG